ncbi:MAG: enoyl-CoA hydratase-related protein, partial [Acidimicrobiales bacterium]
CLWFSNAARGSGVHRLPRQLPIKLAMEYLLTGKEMTAAEALEHGLVNRVAPTAGLDDALMAEYPAVVAMMASADAKEGPLPFSEKRAPHWTGS